MDNNCGIYCIQNKVNGKLYVGQSINLKRRKTKHFSELKKNCHINKHLQRAYNKYGKENFKFKVLLLCEEDDLTYYENFFINHFRSQANGYNICDASSPPDNRGQKNGMYGAVPPNKRIDIEENILNIAKEYKNGMPLSHLAKKYGIARRHMRAKLRMVFSKEEMAIINQQNSKSPLIKHDNHKGTTHNINSRINMSRAHNTSGYFRVSYDKYKGGSWIYKYYDDKGKRRKISAKTLDKLEKKVKDRNLTWMKFEDEG